MNRFKIVMVNTMRWTIFPTSTLPNTKEAQRSMVHFQYLEMKIITVTVT